MNGPPVPADGVIPRVSVIIPTYNRSGLLRRTLDTLLAQRFPTTDFEVVVADDGSSDDTRQVVAEYAARLPTRYHFQVDKGFRAGTARNAGARLATAPVLVFVDTGTLPGPDFLTAHLAVHARSDPASPGWAVGGYMYGYRPGEPTPGLDDAVRTLPPEEIVRRYRRVPSFRDLRDLAFATYRFGRARPALPWQMFWSMNCSVRAADFWAVGGFDESLRGWGGEDIDLGLGLHRYGARFELSHAAWAVDAPHERDVAGNARSNSRNVLRILHKHPTPSMELLYAWLHRDQPWCQRGPAWYIEPEYAALTEATMAAREVDVTAELAQLRDVPPGTRVAVFGCGGTLPTGLPPAVLVDFDEQLLRRLPADPRYPVQHGVGIRTVLPDDAVDLVFVSSRLRGLWQRWRPYILAEAHRIGRSVRGPLADPETAPATAPVRRAGQAG